MIMLMSSLPGPVLYQPKQKVGTMVRVCTLNKPVLLRSLRDMCFYIHESQMKLHQYRGICIQWTGVLDWSAGLECWTGVTGLESLEWSTGGHNA